MLDDNLISGKGSDDAVSDDSNYTGSKELTHDEFRKSIPASSRPPKNPRKGLLSRSFRHPKNRSVEMSGDQNSVAGRTVGSNDATVMVSNRYEMSTKIEDPAKKTKPWKTFKRRMKGKTVTSAEGGNANLDLPPNSPIRVRARSEAASQNLSPKVLSPRKRLGSEGSNAVSSEDLIVKRDQRILDDAIKGRLDGMDVLYLGSARLASLSSEDKDDDATMEAVEDAIDQPITTPSLKYLSSQIVTDMMWTSAGKATPEMLLEGFIPSGDDRWTVRMEVKPPPSIMLCHSNDNTSLLCIENGGDVMLSELSAFCGDMQPCTNDTTDDAIQNYGKGSITPVSRLMQNMWGDNTPPPTHMSRTQSGKKLGEDEDDEVLQLAAACSVPVDIDEDTFIIDTPAHLQAVHDISIRPLKSGQYEDALEVFRKILKGLHPPTHLIGSTRHNIGIIMMWQGKFDDALENFTEAKKSRVEDSGTAVSLLRTGLAHFSLENFDSAVTCFKETLKLTGKENATRAKVLNNLGATHYQKRDFVDALKAFAGALQIQKVWLDGPIRRDSIVFDTTITMSNMGKVYLELKDYDSALIVYEEALLLQTTAFRKDHPMVIATRSNLAYTKAKNRDTKKAIHLYRSVRRSQEARCGVESREVAETAGLLGILYMRQDHTKSALPCLRTALEWQQKHLPASNPSLQANRVMVRKIEESKEGAKSNSWL